MGEHHQRICSEFVVSAEFGATGVLVIQGFQLPERVVPGIVGVPTGVEFFCDSAECTAVSSGQRAVGANSGFVLVAGVVVQGVLPRVYSSSMP